MITKKKGLIAEAMFLSKCVELGINIFLPYEEKQYYDYIVDFNNKLLRISCKSGRIEGNSIVASVGSVCYRNGKYCRQADSNLDVYSVYVPQLKNLYLIPYSKGLSKIDITNVFK